MRLPFAALFCTVAALNAAVGQEIPKSDPPKADPPKAEVAGGAKVYKAAIPSVVWIHSVRPGALATGSGTLIDADKRLVLTNYHVVADIPKVTAFFPVFREGQAIAERQYYTDRAKRLGVPGKVLAVDKSADLAVIQLESVPAEVKAVPLAKGSPDPGEPVHSIGSAGASGALFGYVKGSVRVVYQKKWKAELERGKTINFDARVIETDSPTNPGDSGGPLLNDQGQLVGVTQGGVTNAQLVSYFIDIKQVQKLLENGAVRTAKGAEGASDTPAPKTTATEAPKTRPATPSTIPLAKRTEPLAVRDDAKLFTEAGKKEIEAAVAELFKGEVEVLVETYAVAPAEWVARARKATPAERQELFEEWAKERLKAEDSQGVAILVCMDPRVVRVEMPGAVREKYPEGQAQKVGAELVKAFGKKEYDKGVLEALKLLKPSEKKGKS